MKKRGDTDHDWVSAFLVSVAKKVQVLLKQVLQTVGLLRVKYCINVTIRNKYI